MRLAALVLAIAACGTSPGPVEPSGPPPVKMLQMNKPGELIDIESQLPAGYVSVVDFWGEHCGACEVVGGMLEQGVAAEATIVIRKIDVGDGFTPVATHYKIGALPHFRLYDKRGQMRYVLVGNDTTKASELAKQLAAEP